MRRNVNPTVSVLMAVYNAQRYLAEAIESVLRQTYQDFEFVIIDDGSTDASPGIVACYAALDRRVRLYRQDNAGLATALNRGIEMARGVYVARMDADDVCLPQRLERQVHAMDTDANLALVAGGVTWINSEGLELGQWAISIPPAAMRSALHSRNKIIHPTVLFRKVAVSSAGGYRPAFRYAQDYDLWLRLAEQGSLACVPEVVLKYRLHGSQLSVASVEGQALAAVAARYAAARRAATGRDPLDATTEISYDALMQAGLPSQLAAQRVLEAIEQNGVNHAGMGDIASARRIAASIKRTHARALLPRQAHGAEQTILFAARCARRELMASVPHLCGALFCQPLRLTRRLSGALYRRLGREMSRSREPHD